jgi:hypothetical protein
MTLPSSGSRRPHVDPSRLAPATEGSETPSAADGVTFVATVVIGIYTMVGFELSAGDRFCPHQFIESADGAVELSFLVHA